MKFVFFKQNRLCSRVGKLVLYFVRYAKIGRQLIIAKSIRNWHHPAPAAPPPPHKNQWVWLCSCRWIRFNDYAMGSNHFSLASTKNYYLWSQKSKRVVWERRRRKRQCVCVCVAETEKVRVCVRGRERETERKKRGSWWSKIITNRNFRSNNLQHKFADI